MTDVAERLEELRDRGLYRRLRLVNGPQGPRVLLDGRPVLLLCSNNYLGLADHPQVREAAAEAAMRWGAGAGASRLISGNMEPHRRLESRLAEFKGYEAALLFGSGYLANTGAIAALAGAGEVVFSDELNHASIIDGCRLSRAETFVYRHGDLEHLAWGLREAGGRGSLIVTDGVFSMDGDVAPLPELLRAGPPPRLPADGRRGPRHRGDRARAVAARSPPPGSAARSTWSSAPSARRSAPTAPTPAPARETIDFLVNTARPFVFSTAPPPPSVAAAHGGAGAARLPGPGRAPAGERGGVPRGARRRGPRRRPLADPDRADRGRRRRAHDGALRAAARARRLRPGDPPPDRPRGLLAPALHGDGHPPQPASWSAPRSWSAAPPASSASLATAGRRRLTRCP